MDLAEPAQLVAAIASSIAAVAAATSAILSRSAVERGNFAFVWPDFRVSEDESDGFSYVLVRLRSDGPGIALDVRWSLYFMPEPGRTARRRAESEAEATASSAVRALRPGACSPPERQAIEGRRIHPDLRDEPWSVVVRWSDSAGRRWEFVESTQGRRLAHKPRKLRAPTW